MDLNLLTPGFTTSNGSAFLFPLMVFRNEIRNASINITLMDRSNPAISECDVVAIDSKEFRDVPINRQSEIQDLISSYRNSNAKIIWFDTTDSTGTLQADMLPVVNKYVKAQLLNNRSRYENTIYGGREHSEYYFNSAGIVDNNDVAINKPISHNEISKLGISWNSGLADYSTYGPLKIGLYRRFRWLSLLRYATPHKLPNGIRTNNVSARFGISYNRATVRYQREQIRMKLSSRLDTKKLNRRAYMKELLRSKIVISPFGWGEITLKDFEVFLTGGMLIKPSMNHLETWPNFYTDNVTYQSHNWDMSDLEEKIEWALDNESHRQYIANEGRKRYLEYTSGPNAAETFVRHLTNVLSMKTPTTVK